MYTHYILHITHYITHYTLYYTLHIISHITHYVYVTLPGTFYNFSPYSPSLATNFLPSLKTRWACLCVHAH